MINALNGQVPVKQARAGSTMEEIAVDGLLNEAAWESVEGVTGFIQFQPDRGKLSPYKTIAKILLDKEFLYVGFLCYDSQPDKIAAQVTKRDQDIKDDDSVYVILDTFHDRRNAYYVGINLLGTQWDGRISQNGLNQDTNWDGIWKASAKRTDYGWSAEIAIDLSCLKFKPGRDGIWGINLGRGVPRTLEFSFWNGPLESPYMVSQYGDLTGLNLERSRKKTQIIPHIISKFEEGKDTEAEIGVDARYAFSQQVSGNLTVNPDFATVEADQEEINLTRFEQNLSEKRNFFLEGSEIYRQRINLFYSRRISDIYGGAKIYGKAGGYEFSALSAQTRKDEAEGIDSANFSVFRLKKDVMKSSTVGVLAANKLVNGRNMGTAGIDTSINFTDTFSFTGQMAFSYGDFKDRNIAFFLRPSYDTSTFHIHLRYTHLGEHFGDNANSVGYVRDDNRHELDSAVEKTFWIKKWGLERIAYESNYNIYWGMDGTLRSWGIDEEIGFDLINKFSLQLEHHEDFKLYEKKFRNRESVLELGYNTREWQSASLAYAFGRNYDSDFKLVEAQFNAKLNKKLSLSYDLTRLWLDPDPEQETTWIHVVRATNYFTNDLFLKVFYQINSTIDKKNIQVVFVWRFQPPFGSLQIAYQKGTARFGERGNQGHTLFLKFAYMF